MLLGLWSTWSSRGGSPPSAPAALLARRRSRSSVKVAGCRGALVAAGEVFLAKLRLFRVPELLAGSFVLALLAVTASYLVA